MYRRRRFEMWSNPHQTSRRNARSKTIAQSGRHRVWGIWSRCSTRTSARRPPSLGVRAGEQCGRGMGLRPGNWNRFVRDQCRPEACAFKHVRIVTDQLTSRDYVVHRFPISAHRKRGIPKRHPAVPRSSRSGFLFARLCGTLWAYGLHSLLLCCGVRRCKGNRRKEGFLESKDEAIGRDNNKKFGGGFWCSCGLQWSLLWALRCANSR